MLLELGHVVFPAYADSTAGLAQPGAALPRSRTSVKTLRRYLANRHVDTPEAKRRRDAWLDRTWRGVCGDGAQRATRPRGDASEGGLRRLADRLRILWHGTVLDGELTAGRFETTMAALFGAKRLNALDGLAAAAGS